MSIFVTIKTFFSRGNMERFWLHVKIGLFPTNWKWWFVCYHIRTAAAESEETFCSFKYKTIQSGRHLLNFNTTSSRSESKSLTLGSAHNLSYRIPFSLANSTYICLAASFCCQNLSVFFRDQFICLKNWLWFQCKLMNTYYSKSPVKRTG